MKANEPSDPYLMTGFDNKVLHLKTDKSTEFRIEIDFLGNGEWDLYETTAMATYSHHVFPKGFSAHWVRLVPLADCTATAEFIYT